MQQSECRENSIYGFSLPYHDNSGALLSLQRQMPCNPSWGQLDNLSNSGPFFDVTGGMGMDDGPPSGLFGAPNTDTLFY